MQARHKYRDAYLDTPARNHTRVMVQHGSGRSNNSRL